MEALRNTIGWILLLAVLIGVPMAWHEAVLDDAFIAFRYAHHLVSGHGLVFNPGERVEGFTSPLWTLVIAAGMAAGADPAILAQVLAILCNVALVLAVYRFGRRTLGLSPSWAWAAGALLVADFNTEAWAAHGLETNLFALLVFLGVAALVREGREGTGASRLLPLSPGWRSGPQGAAWLGLAVWARPEGLVFLPLVMAFEALWQGMKHLGGKRARQVGGPHGLSGVGRVVWEAWRPFLPGVAVWSAMVVALFLGRFAYYGAWLPNTYYAKATGGAGSMVRGVGYFLEFVASSWLYGLLLIPAAAALVLRPTRARGLMAAVVGVVVAYVVWLGGDTFKGARFFMPALAPFALLVVDGLAAIVVRLRVGPKIRAAAAVVAMASLLGGVAAGTWRPLAAQAHLAASMTRNRAYLGKLLRAITPPDTVLALTTVGALPYYAERPVIDLYGLTDAHIARVRVRPGEGGGTGHEKGDGAYVLSRAPDLILLRNVWIADVPIEDYHALWGLSERQIVADLRFQRDYVPVNLRLRPDLLFGFYANRRKVDVDALLARFAQLDLHALGPLDRLNSERGMDLVLLHQGLELAAAGRLDAARAALERSLRIYPKSVDAHLALARLLERTGDVPGAIRELEAALALQPSRRDILAALGSSYARIGRLDQAVACLRQAAEQAPEDVQVWRDLATVLLKRQQHTEAVSALRRVVALSPDDHGAWVKLGVSAGLTGGWQEAYCALERAEALAPGSPEVAAFQKWFESRRPEGFRPEACGEKGAQKAERADR